MKKVRIIIVMAALLMLQIPTAWGRSLELAEKEKKIHNQYTVQDLDKLSIDNIYGNVHVNTWDKNEVTVDVTITAKAKNEDAAQTMLDRVNINISTNGDGGHKIDYKTEIDEPLSKGKNSEITINYTINAPKKNALDIINKYGDVYLGDLAGKLRLMASYGAVDIQNLTGGDKIIKATFGKAMINSIEHGNLDISYANVSIDKAGDITLTNKFGNTDVTSGEKLAIDQKYGNVKLGSVSELSGTFDYGNLVIDDLQKSAYLSLKYCGKAELRSVGPNVNKIDMDAHYSDFECHFAEGANLSISMTTSYSNVKNAAFLKSAELSNVNHDPSIKSGRYEGKAGKGEGEMVIDAHYSNISFR